MGILRAIVNFFRRSRPAPEPVPAYGSVPPPMTPSYLPVHPGHMPGHMPGHLQGAMPGASNYPPRQMGYSPSFVPPPYVPPSLPPSHGFPLPSGASRPPSSQFVSAAPPSAAELEWARIKEFLRACEVHDINLGHLHREDPVGFWARRVAIDADVARGMPHDRAAANHGFQDAQHWRFVERYFEARYSALNTRPDGTHEIRYAEEFRKARDLVVRRKDEASRAAEIDRRLLEPIQGITVERFGEICAIVSELGAAPSRVELSTVLNGLGIGSAGYGAVRRGWLERMQQEPTGALKKRYQDSFRRMRQHRIGSGVHRRSEVEAGEASSSAAAARRTWVETDEVAS